MAKASDNLFPYVHLVPAAAPASPATGSERLYLDSADGKLKRKNSSGTVTTIEGAAAGGTGQGLVDFARAKRTSGDLTLTSTTFVNVDTGLDLVMNASAGDVIEAEVAAKIRLTATSGSTYAVFDFCTVVGGNPVNSLTSESAAGTGLTSSFPGWASGQVQPDGVGSGPAVMAGIKRYTLQAGDISSGTVTLRLRAFVGASCTLRASDPMLYVQASNLGQQL